MIRLFLFLLLAAVSQGCVPEPENRGPDETMPHDTVNGPVVRYARGFSIAEEGGYIRITVFNPWHAYRPYYHYWLYRANQTPPELTEANAIALQIPVRRMALMSTTHLGMLCQLNSRATAVAFSNPSFIYDDTLCAMAGSGRLRTIGEIDNLNSELVLDLAPDVLMISGSERMPLAAGRLLQTGLPVMVNLEWMEQTPLGRAEWLRLMGLLLGREQQADSLFADIALSYLQLQKLAQSSADRPSVMIGNNYRGTWYMPGGGSYVANLLRDAAAEYHWFADSSAGSLPLSFESVLHKQLESEVWLQPGAFTSKAALLGEDARYSSFSAFQSGRLYNSTARINTFGASDYWESGPMQPQVLLADLVRILHPELLPDYQPVYYQIVE